MTSHASNLDMLGERPISPTRAGLPEHEEVRRHAALFSGEFGESFLDADPAPAFILNADRRIVCHNASFREILGLPLHENAIGRRFGEVIACQHAGPTGVSCGTGEPCSRCAAAQAALSALTGQPASRECRVMASGNGHPKTLDLMIRSVPFQRDGLVFAICSAQDVSHEKRRRALERVFFQDVLNMADGLHNSLSELARRAPPSMRLEAELMDGQLETMMDEIESQKELLAAENDELSTRPEPVDGRLLLRELALRYERHDVSVGKRIVVEEEPGPVDLVIDVRLLRRVIGNMLKNALEASRPDQIVALRCRGEADRAIFSVHNQTGMPKSVQLQVFTRSFSTKGPGRGLGTYSMRLLSTRYLRGETWFETSMKAGTTFFAAYPLTPPDCRDQASAAVQADCQGEARG